ncbi:hypothetical protein Tco_1217360 [Tanacetum coccineum]
MRWVQSCDEYSVTEGRQSKETEELNVTHDTKVLEKGGSNEEPVNVASNIGVSTTFNISTASRPEVSTATPMTPPTTTSVFEDEDIFLADALVMLNKGKGVLEEEPKPVKVKSKDQGEAQIERDAEIALKVHAELDEEARLERQRQEQASMNYIASLYDEVQARIDADHELAVRWTQEEQEKYIVDERAKLVAEYFENRKKQLAEERAVLYIKEHERITDFVPIGSERDERMIEKMHKKAAGVHEEKVLEEPDSTKVEVKQEGNKESTRKRLGRRLKMKPTKKSRMQKTDSDLEEEEHLNTFLMLVPDEEGIIDYEVLEKRFPIIIWESKFYHLDRHGAECIYYRIFRSDESFRWIKTFFEMVTMFDRLDLEELYNLVMQRFESTTPEGVDLNCGVHTLILEDGTEIHMLAERKYPLTKETLERMLSLKLIAESTSESAYNLLRHQELASPEQMTSGKDFSNSLMADSLRKTIWFSTHHAYSKELASLKQTAIALAIPEQTATGKEISNPFMAGSLPKTIRPT